MSTKDSITPSVLIAKFRENQNNNKTLKAAFSNQFLTKFTTEELEGLNKSINKELETRQQEIIDEKIAFLTSMGYSVSK